jgi:hypothetical protein
MVHRKFALAKFVVIYCRLLYSALISYVKSEPRKVNVEADLVL